MSVEGLDAGKQLAIVANGDENLCVGADGSLKDRQWAGREFMLFELSNLVLPMAKVSSIFPSRFLRCRAFNSFSYVSSERGLVRSSLIIC